MKNIKFRVWCKENEQFIQFNKMGFFEDGSLWYVQEVDENEKEIDPPYFENRNDWELMQYTGLKDEHGVAIFEGDIVVIENHPFQKTDDSDVGMEINGNYEVGWNADDLTWCAGSLLLARVKNYVRVVGNIYENNDLI